MLPDRAYPWVAITGALIALWAYVRLARWVGHRTGRRP